MNSERRKYPRVAIGGEVNIRIAGVVRNGTLLNLSPSGIQIECRHRLIEQLARFKTAAGLYPDFELEFTLSVSGHAKQTIKSPCNVFICRRLRQDSYHLGLNFITLSAQDEKNVSDYINHSQAA